VWLGKAYEMPHRPRHNVTVAVQVSVASAGRAQLASDITRYRRFLRQHGDGTGLQIRHDLIIMLLFLIERGRARNAPLLVIAAGIVDSRKEVPRQLALHSYRNEYAAGTGA
jgi:hypothetical protein